MKIYYIVNNRMPSEMAYGVHIINMCRALAEQGADLTLVFPKRKNKIKEDVFSYYETKKIFKVKKLPAIDLLFLKIPFAFYIETITFFVSLFFYFVFKKEKAIVYTRGETILFLTKLLPKRYSIFWETHIKPMNFNRYKNAFNKSKGIIVANNYYRNELVHKYRLPEEKIIFLPDGVDLEKFNIQIGKKEAREKLGLPLDKKIIIYTGSDIKWKGLDILKKASNLLSGDFLVVLVGKIKDESKKYNNIKFVGHKSYTEIPQWLKAADFLVLTGAKESEISTFYTSPLKQFEYMASGKPIIAAGLNSFKETLSDNTAIFYDSNNPKDLAEKIKNSFDNYEFAKKKAESTFKEVSQYDWKVRAEKVIKFMLK